MSSKFLEVLPSSRSCSLGVAFLLLALFSGVLGGMMALPVIRLHPSSGIAICHAILMSFFVICPASLGGMSQWLLPSALQAQRMALPGFSLIAWGFLAVGVVLLPLWSEGGLALWALGMVLLSIDVIASVLEERRIAFRAFSPFIWAMLATSVSGLLVAPVLLALLIRGWTAVSLVNVLSLPEITLMLIPALGLVSMIFQSRPEAGIALAWRCAPYIFGVMALVGPLLWIDHLFGEIPSSIMGSVVIFSVILPCLLFLSLLCVALWRCPVAWGAVSFWAFVATVLLMTGAWNMCWPYHSALQHGQMGHQALVFGCLLALCVGFYAWFRAHVLPVGKGMPRRIFDRFGTVHALVTSIGVVCSIIPWLVPYAPFFMGISLLGFVAMGLGAAQLVLRSRFHKDAVSIFEG